MIFYLGRQHGCQNGAQLGRYTLIFWGPSWAPSWGRAGAPEDNFWRPQQASLNPLIWDIILEAFWDPFSKDSLCKMITRGVSFWRGFGHLVGASKKMSSGAPGLPRPPPTWSPTWTSKYEFIGSNLAPILEGVLAAQNRFFEANMALCWLHVDA